MMVRCPIILLFFFCIGCENTKVKVEVELPKLSPTTSTKASEFNLFDKSLESRPVRAKSVGKDLVYDVPKKCKLTYQVSANLRMNFRFNDTTKLTAGMQNSGLDLFGQFVLGNRSPSGLRIQFDHIELRHTQGIRRNPAIKQDGSQLAPIHLVKSGLGLQEVDGVTSTWSAYGTWPGATVFFPTLPSSAVIGSKTSWTLKIHSRQSGVKTEIDRGQFKLPATMTIPPVVGKDYTASVVLKKWFDIGGQKAAWLTANWTDESTKTSPLPNGEIETKSSQTNRGDYLVLENGRILVGRLRGENDVSMKSTFGERARSNRQKHTIDAEMRLVKGCDSENVIAKKFDRKIEPSEQILTAWRNLINRVAQGKYNEAVSFFSSELRDKYGTRIGDVLRAHTDRYSTLVLGTPEISSRVKKWRGGFRIHLTGSARNYESNTDGNMTINTMIEATIKNGKPVITRVGSDTVGKTAMWRLLEISKTRLFSKAEEESGAQ